MQKKITTQEKYRMLQDNTEEALRYVLGNMYMNAHAKVFFIVFTIYASKTKY